MTPPQTRLAHDRATMCMLLCFTTHVGSHQVNHHPGVSPSQSPPRYPPHPPPLCLPQVNCHVICKQLFTGTLQNSFCSVLGVYSLFPDTRDMGAYFTCKYFD